LASSQLTKGSVEDFGRARRVPKSVRVLGRKRVLGSVNESVKCIGGKSICVDEKNIEVVMIVSGAKDRCAVYL
jgi:hypothetical protein